MGKGEPKAPPLWAYLTKAHLVQPCLQIKDFLTLRMGLVNTLNAMLSNVYRTETVTGAGFSKNEILSENMQQ